MFDSPISLTSRHGGGGGGGVGWRTTFQTSLDSNGGSKRISFFKGALFMK